LINAIHESIEAGREIRVGATVYQFLPGGAE
jgi:hypothetical protein